MADLENPVVLVTGANTGIGKETVRALAASGARVYLACRSESKTTPVIEELRQENPAADLRFLQLDLGDLDSVRACAKEFLATGDPLHILINNAGLAGHRGQTKSGFELAFGTNHLGHFLLTDLLLELLRESAPARVVTVSSMSHYDADGIDFDAVCRPTKSMTGLPEYSVSKLANLLFTEELARRLEGTGVTTYALHPGVIASDVWRGVPWPFRSVMKLFMKSVQDGAKTTLYCATSPEVADESGHYYDKSRRKEPSAVATPELAAVLWKRSVEWVRD